MPASNQVCLTSYFPSLKTDIPLHETVWTSTFQHLFLNCSMVIVLLKQVTEIKYGHFLSHHLSHLSLFYSGLRYPTDGYSPHILSKAELQVKGKV